MRLFDVRALAVLTLALLIAAVAGALTLAAGANWPTALLASGGAGWTALTGLPRLLR